MAEVSFFSTVDDGYEREPLDPKELEALVERVANACQDCADRMIKLLQAEKSNGVYHFDPDLLREWTHYHDPISMMKEISYLVNSIPDKVGMLKNDNGEAALDSIEELKLAVEGLEDIKDQKESLLGRMVRESALQVKQDEESPSKKRAQEDTDEFEKNVKKLKATVNALDCIFDQKTDELDHEETMFRKRKCLVVKLQEWLVRREGSIGSLSFEDIQPTLKEINSLLCLA